jgi:F-box-like
MAEDYTRTEERLETRMSAVRQPANSIDRCDVDEVTIDVLPDNVLLDIFDFYIQEARRHPYADNSGGIEGWNTLVHVCRRWRSVVFESPLRLDLRLLCMDKTPVREMLDIWPPLPIMIQAEGSIPDVDNIVASLKHNDRICEIILYKVPNLLLEKICATLMQESFPVLTTLLTLLLVSRPEMDFVVPPGPLSGGSAPLLRQFALYDVPFPESPSFLSSSVNHLTSLTLYNIPHSGYISPEVMVTCISALISLTYLRLIPIASFSPRLGKPTSASADTLCPTLSPCI